MTPQLERIQKVPVTPLVPSELVPALNPTLVVDGAGLEKVKNFFERCKEPNIDFETSIADFYQDRRARLFQIGNTNEQYLIDLLAFADGKTERLIKGQGYFYGQASELVTMLEPLDPCLQPVIDVIKPVMESGEFLKIGQNLGFEYTVLWWCFGIRMWKLYSIDVAERVLLAGLVPPFAKGHFAMDDMVRKYLRKEIDKSLQKSFDLENPLTQEQVVYAALDVRLPERVRMAQLPELDAEGQRMPAEFIEMNAIGAFEDMHMWGFYLNSKDWLALLQTVRDTHKQNIAKLDEYFLSIVGQKGVVQHDLDALEDVWRDTPQKTPEDKALRAQHRKAWMAARKKMSENSKALPTYEGEAAINYGSSTQLLQALYKVKGLNKRNLPDTNDDTLKNLSKEFPILKALRDYRTTQKKISTYGEDWLQHINPVTGRVHSKFSQLGTETGRPSSAKPNLYNLPKEKEVRSCWQAQPPQREGQPKNKIHKRDMSGAELRILTDQSKAKSWEEAFAKDWDIHSVSTEILYPQDWPTLSAEGCAYFNDDHKKCECPQHLERRDGTKATNFLIINGGGPRKLSTDLDCDYEVAMQLMDVHRKKFPDVWGYLDKCGDYAKQNMRSVPSLSGRFRKFTRPTWEIARQKCIEDRKRDKKEGLPTSDEISRRMRGLFGHIERQGKNAPLQSSNADIAKIAMGAGYDPDGKPFLWHILWPKFRARFVLFLYDEFVVEVPEQHAEECSEAMADAIKRAGKMLLKRVEMKSEGNIEDYWKK
jgi:DNA polymerase I-like protein with 3'-5' exonuclease and polymerase domains